MRDSIGVAYRFALLCAGLLTIGCGGPQRPFPAGDAPMSMPPSPKEIISTDTSWEREFGLVQGVKANGIVVLSGQMSVDENGGIVGKGSMEAQMPMPMWRRYCSSSISR